MSTLQSTKLCNSSDLTSSGSSMGTVSVDNLKYSKVTVLSDSQYPLPFSSSSSKDNSSLHTVVVIPKRLWIIYITEKALEVSVVEAALIHIHVVIIVVILFVLWDGGRLLGGFLEHPFVVLIRCSVRCTGWPEASGAQSRAKVGRSEVEKIPGEGGFVIRFRCIVRFEFGTRISQGSSSISLQPTEWATSSFLVSGLSFGGSGLLSGSGQLNNPAMRNGRSAWYMNTDLG
jgi:hypothetical protein